MGRWVLGSASWVVRRGLWVEYQNGLKSVKSKPESIQNVTMFNFFFVGES